jgi:hypothetical protein
MKALLPTGDHLELPDGTSKEQATAIVKAHFAAKANERARLDADDKRKRDMVEQDRHKASIGATQEVGKSVSEGMNNLSKKLEASSTGLIKLGTKLEAISDLVDAINTLAGNSASLEKCIRESTETIVKTLKSPRKIVTNTKGKPIGLQIGEE